MADTTTAQDTPIADQLAQEILDARLQHLRQQIRPQNKRDYLYLSDVHTCTRHNYYSMVEGDKRNPINEFLQARFEAGNIWEQKIVAQLLDMGFQVTSGQVTVEIKHKDKILGRGKIDGKIRFRGKTIPCEIKNLDGNIFRRINCVEDLFEDEWLEKYVRQLLLYMYGQNEEEGIFLITDRGGLWKVLPIYLGNYLDYAELTLRNMERSMEAKDRGEIPDRITYHPKICGRCQFNAVCLPTTVIEGGETLQDPEIENLLERHTELKEKAAEFEEIHDTIKDLFKEKPQTTVGGRFIVKPKKRVRTSYDAKLLDPEARKAIKKETEFWVIEIEKIPEAAAK